MGEINLEREREGDKRERSRKKEKNCLFHFIKEEGASDREREKEYRLLKLLLSQF